MVKATATVEVVAITMTTEEMEADPIIRVGRATGKMDISPTSVVKIILQLTSPRR